MDNERQIELISQYMALEIDVLRFKLQVYQVKNRRKRRRLWQIRWLLRRPLYGQYERLVSEMEDEDVAGFRNFIRVDPEMFQDLITRLGPRKC